MLCHPYDTPTFKTNVLCLVSNEGLVKCLLLLYKQLIQPRPVARGGSVGADEPPSEIKGPLF